tara:strand:+ start:2629 stop:3801 length:1173 start_codon:yes stop_codon:yes gene_type:complete
MSSHIRVGTITLTLLLPILLVGLSSPLSMQVQAAESCAGDTTPIRWNETAQRMALVPFYNGNWWNDWDDMYFEDYEGDEGNGDKGDGEMVQDTPPSPENPLNPEEEWMYRDWMKPRLDPLEENHYTTMLIGNDSVGILRVNLSADYRTTVCIRLQDMNLNAVEGDVYLLTTEEYDNYAQSYQAAHEQNFYEYEDIERSLSNIPPEWRSFNFLGWKSYRDSHEYEQTSEVNFALNLDGPEIYSSLFTGTEWQDFYIVIDTWDNVHDGDADVPNSIVAADVTIITTERSFILPPFTVSLVFLVVLLGTLSIPFILNAKYMKAGLVSEVPQNIVPSLHTPAQHPAPTSPIPAQSSDSQHAFATPVKEVVQLPNPLPAVHLDPQSIVEVPDGQD